MSDQELIARLRASGRHPMMDNNCKVDVFLVNDAADRIEALIAERDETLREARASEAGLSQDERKALQEALKSYGFYADFEIVNPAKIRALRERLAPALLEEDFELDDEINEDGGDKARVTLAEIKGESHE